MPPKTAQAKVDLEIKRLSKLEGNKQCVDCNEKMPTYIDMTHKVFVCQKCSAIHREMQFKVKGISMTVFSAEDANDIAKVGNIAFNSKYMAKYSSKDSAYIYPSHTDLNKLKEFINLKYGQKKWYSESGQPDAEQVAHETSPIKSNPSNKAAVSVANVTASLDLLSFDAPSSSSSSSAFPSHNTTSNGFDPFNASTPATVSHTSTTASFDPFNANPTPVPATATATATAKRSSFIDSNVDPFAPVNSSNIGHTSNQHIFPSNVTVTPISPPTAVSQQSFDPFGATPVAAPGSARQPTSFDPFGAPTTAAAAAPATATTSHFDPFGNTHAPVAPSTGFSNNTGFNASSNGFPNTTTTGFSQAPTTGGFPLNNGFTPSTGGFSNPVPPTGFGATPMAPMPFIKLNPPKEEPAPVVEVKPAAAPAPVLPGFSAFEELAPPPSANPFDTPKALNPQGGVPAHQAVGGYPPQGPPAGYPGYPGYPPTQPGYPPAGYPQAPYGAPSPYGYPPQAPGGYPGYPPVQPGYPPAGYPQAPAGYPQAPAGYPPAQPPAGYPSSNPFGSPVQASAGSLNPANPFGGMDSPRAVPSLSPVHVTSTPAPVVTTPSAPDPFSSMTNMAWNNVSKPAPLSSTPHIAPTIITPTSNLPPLQQPAVTPFSPAPTTTAPTLDFTSNMAPATTTASTTSFLDMSSSSTTAAPYTNAAVDDPFGMMAASTSVPPPPAPVPAPVVAPPAASVNPFDLF